MRWSRDATPELLAHIRYLYEETDKPVASIAAECEVRERRIYEWIVQHGWRKRRDRPLDLTPELRLTLDIDRALEEAESTSPFQGEVQADGPCLPHTCDSPPDDAVAEPSDALTVADRLERQLEHNLTRVERLRETQWPQSTAEAERTTRVLERLTAALLKVRQLRSPEPKTADTSDTNKADTDDFEIPADMDEFRHALAQRMRAFVRSWTGGGVSGAGETQGAG